MKFILYLVGAFFLLRLFQNWQTANNPPVANAVGSAGAIAPPIPCPCTVPANPWRVYAVGPARGPATPVVFGPATDVPTPAAPGTSNGSSGTNAMTAVYGSN